MYGVAVDLCPRRHSPPSAAGPFYWRSSGRSFVESYSIARKALVFASSNLK